MLVGAAGIEPATTGLENRCSIQLSYAPLQKIYHILPFFQFRTLPIDQAYLSLSLCGITPRPPRASK